MGLFFVPHSVIDLTAYMQTIIYVKRRILNLYNYIVNDILSLGLVKCFSVFLDYRYRFYSGDKYRGSIFINLNIFFKWEMIRVCIYTSYLKMAFLWWKGCLQKINCYLTQIIVLTYMANRDDKVIRMERANSDKFDNLKNVLIFTRFIVFLSGTIRMKQTWLANFTNHLTLTLIA